MTGDLDEDLLKALGISRDKFGKMTEPGTILGTLTPALQELTELKAIPVITVAGHDTASAVAAVPAKDEHFAYLSSGTWSLMGIETPHAIINDKSLERNFTNEGGIEGTTRFLKNICGMWIYECCRREWKEQGLTGLEHKTLQDNALKEAPKRSIINPDDPCFAAPKSMLAAIRTYCETHGQPVPETPAQTCRCIFDSLALRYKTICSWLQEFAPFRIDTLHIIGGGCVNEVLDQLTADALGIRVLAGPQEATALGNIMLQAKAHGEVKDRWEMRAIVGDEVVEKYEIVMHDCRDKASLFRLGEIDGLDIWLNNAVREADFIITTGLIAPHHTAGFSGGRKSILPGITGLDTLKIHHSLPMRPYNPSMGILEGNRFHDVALAGYALSGGFKKNEAKAA